MNFNFKAARNAWKKLPLSIQLSWITVDVLFILVMIAAPEFMAIFTLCVLGIVACFNLVDWWIDGNRRDNYYKSRGEDE